MDSGGTFYILGYRQDGKAPDFDSGKTLSLVGSNPTTPATSGPTHRWNLSLAQN